MQRHLGGMLVVGLWAAGAGVVCRAQNPPANPAPCTVAPQPVPCGGTASSASKPSTADKFPFPGEGSGTGGAANSPAANSPATNSPAPAGDTDPAAKKASGTDFPFPEEDTKPADTKKPVGGDFPFPEEDAKPGSSSSSSSSSSSDDAPDSQPDASGTKDKASDDSPAPQGRRLLHRVNPIGTKLLTPEEREAEDLDVAHFYTQTGDLKGAYLRSQDAVKTAPDDPDAHFALAEAALKLNKRDEAIAEYTACLKLDPVDKEAKAARKQLARLQP